MGLIQGYKATVSLVVVTLPPPFKLIGRHALEFRSTWHIWVQPSVKER
jgi:hypothetical protein